MLPPTSTDRPSTPTGCSRSRCRRRAIDRAWFGVAPGSRTPNSSPPSRATVHSGATAAVRRRATWVSSSSPAWWPRVSLTSLKRSRSMNSTATLSAHGSRAVSWASNSVRFGRPVSMSCRDSCVSRSSSRPLRSAMAAWPATPSRAVTSAGSNVLCSPRRLPTNRVPATPSSPGTATSTPSRTPSASRWSATARSRVLR